MAHQGQGDANPLRPSCELRRASNGAVRPARADTFSLWNWTKSLHLTPPDHTRIRKLVAAAFTPRSVEALRGPARELAGELLGPFTDDGEMELLYDFAQPYSIAVICRMLGVPLDRQRDLLDWSHRMVKMYEFEVPEEAARAANQAAAEFQEYVLELIRERRAHPRDDMVTALVEARVDGGRLSDDEIVSTGIVLLNAGHEASVKTLATS